MHFKDPLVCVVVCPYRTRCKDFALFYDDNREAVDALVAQHYKPAPPKTSSAKSGARAIRALPAATNLTARVARTGLRDLISLEVKKNMAENMFIWIDREDHAVVLKLEDILQRAENGEKAKRIYKIAQEMELKFQVVPRKKIEKVKAKAADDAERAAARQTAKRSRRANGNGEIGDEFDEFISDETPVTTATATTAAAAPRARNLRSAKA